MVKMTDETVKTVPKQDKLGQKKTVPTPAQRRYLIRGLDQAGGKLPLFDLNGKEIGRRTIDSCIANGWAEQWFKNPIKPDWLVCRLTARGYLVLAEGEGT